MTTRALAGIVDAAKGVTERRRFFDDRQEAVHVANGALFMNDGELSFDGEFSPRWRARNRSPLPYDPDAKCPRFLNDLLGPMLSTGDIDFLRRWTGLCLFGRNLAQAILLLDGTPGRGKGVLLRILNALIGTRNICELRTAHLGERFEINRFVGKTLLTASDVPGNFLEQRWASILKTLTGQDRLEAEAKGSNESTEVIGEFNVCIVSNARLRCRLDGDDGAWRRRLAILRTDAPEVKDKIPDFDRLLLRTEGKGILAWAVTGFVDAMADLGNHGTLTRSPEMIGRVNDLLAESNSIELFVKHRLAPARGHDVTVEEIERGFAEFCADRGWTPPAVSKIHHAVGDLVLRVHGASKSHGIKRGDGAKRGFRGIRLLTGN